MILRPGFALAPLLALATLGAPVWAVDLAMPFPATPTFAEDRPFDSHAIATAPLTGDGPQIVAEGAVARRNWRLTEAVPTLRVLAPLRDRLVADGWTVAFDCETDACGGFEFRFAIDVTPAPEMFVDLADFRYLAARKDDAWTTLLVSRAGDRAYVQTTQVTPTDATALPPPAPATQVDALPDAPIGPTGDTALIQMLIRNGHAVLADLDFATGTTDLARDDYASLAELATFLETNPDMTVALVGHTDAVGGAAGNVAISERRAASAAARLTGRYGIAPGRVEVRGVGYFAPIARNDTEEGRRANRRVEVVITSTG